ncbi:MAG: ATP-binding protein [Verrucomicrobiota bacterium]
MHGLDRKLKQRILELLEYSPAVALLGPRQCGKTTLAFEIKDRWLKQATYLDLENAADLAKLDDAVGYLKPREEQLVIMDEVQHRPALFPEIRGLIDDGRRRGLRNGRFLFLGSASYELLKQSGESLAGRIAFLELTPFRVDEIEQTQLDQLWLRGGFPDSFLAPKETISTEWRRNFIDTYLTRDLSMYGKAEALPAMRDLLKMTAHLHGQVLNIRQLVESHDFSRQQIGAYLDLFEHTFVIRRLNPYFKNVGKRLTKRPKIYIRDSGLLHQLVGISDQDTLSGHPTRGNSWEGFVIEQIIVMLPDWEPYFYRTSNGAELDLIMLKGDKLLAFEIKASVDAKLTKGFYTARDDIEPDEIFIVSRNNDTWESNGIIYTNLIDLTKRLSG